MSDDGTDTLTLRDVRRLDLNDGDTLVILLEQRASQDTMTHIRGHMRENFPGHKCLVLDAGTDLAVITGPRTTNDTTSF